MDNDGTGVIGTGKDCEHQPTTGWRARLLGGWCPITGHPRLRPRRGLPWCPQCDICWDLTGDGPEILNVRRVHHGIFATQAVDPCLLDRVHDPDDALGHVLADIDRILTADTDQTHHRVGYSAGSCVIT